MTFNSYPMTRKDFHAFIISKSGISVSYTKHSFALGDTQGAPHRGPTRHTFVPTHCSPPSFNVEHPGQTPTADLSLQPEILYIDLLKF